RYGGRRAAVLLEGEKATRGTSRLPAGKSGRESPGKLSLRLSASFPRGYRPGPALQQEQDPGGDPAYGGDRSGVLEMELRQQLQSAPDDQPRRQHHRPPPGRSSPESDHESPSLLPPPRRLRLRWRPAGGVSIASPGQWPLSRDTTTVPRWI